VLKISCQIPGAGKEEGIGRDGEGETRCPGARKGGIGRLGDREIGSEEESETGDRKTDKWS
jgi:hypothetical protein